MSTLLGQTQHKEFREYGRARKAVIHKIGLEYFWLSAEYVGKWKVFVQSSLVRLQGAMQFESR